MNINIYIIYTHTKKEKRAVAESIAKLFNKVFDLGFVLCLIWGRRGNPKRTTNLFQFVNDHSKGFEDGISRSSQSDNSLRTIPF